MGNELRSTFQFRAACAMAVAAVIPVAGAQTGTAADSPELEEVIVTAERREVNLQDVPASATVLTAGDLAAKGIDNVNEIQTVAPSVAINTYNRSTFINIRGVGIGQRISTNGIVCVATRQSFSSVSPSDRSNFRGRRHFREG